MYLHKRILLSCENSKILPLMRTQMETKGIVPNEISQNVKGSEVTV